MNEKLRDILRSSDSCISESMLFRYVERNLSAEEMRRVEEHISSCDLCSDAIDGIMGGNLVQSAEMIDSINNEIQKRISVKKVFPLRRLMQAAAAVFILAVSAWIINLVIQKPAEKIFSEEFKPYQPAYSDTIIPAPSTEKGLPPAQQKNSTGQPADKQGIHDVNPSPVKKKPVDISNDEVKTDESATEPAVNNMAAPEAAYQRVEAKPDSLALSDRNVTGDKATESYSLKSQPAQSGSTRNLASDNMVQPAIINNFNLAMREYEADHYAEAIAAFELVLRDDPKNIVANFYSGVSSLALNNPDEALKYFAKTDFKTSAFYEATLWYEALANISKGNKKTARSLLEKIVILNGEHKTQAEETLKQL